MGAAANPARTANFILAILIYTIGVAAITTAFYATTGAELSDQVFAGPRTLVKDVATAALITAGAAITLTPATLGFIFIAADLPRLLCQSKTKRHLS